MFNYVLKGGTFDHAKHCNQWWPKRREDANGGDPERALLLSVNRQTRRLLIMNMSTGPLTDRRTSVD